MVLVLKTALKAFVFVVGLLALITVSFLWYFYLTYIDETTLEGAVYGYAIGQSKPEAYSVATVQFANDEISGLHIWDPFETFDATDRNYPIIKSADLWTVFPDDRDNFRDSVKLHFSARELVKIHRHRQRFELP
jgi:hypothetical protein